MSLVTSDWLENNLNDVKIIDCSWHMPGIDRNPEEEYSKNHIPGAIFFDLPTNLIALILSKFDLSSPTTTKPIMPIAL